MNEKDEEDASPTRVGAGSEMESTALLPLIMQQSEQNKEAKKHVRFIDNGQVELISPNKKGIVRIKNCKVPISTSALRFEEL